MNFAITDKKKKDIFISIFQLLKCSSSQIHSSFDKENLHIQGMDKSHVCLFDLTLNSNWFNNYDVIEETNICFDSSIFYSMISVKNDEQNLEIKKDGEDSLAIHFINGDKKGDYNKFFTLPLLEYDYNEMSIPDADYDAEFSISSKKVTDMLSQLSNFGNDLTIKCSDNDVDFKTKGNSGEMRVNIKVDDLLSYGLIEGGEVNLTYSLIYVSKMCITNKISTEIEFSLSNECPMKIKYDLGSDSYLMFYIAPKIADD
jgi:proliferating cell nuclear antigen PCNA